MRDMNEYDWGVVLAIIVLVLCFLLFKLGGG
jgi:Flp pilus assembly protein protease CpaA